jgi:hypothetical protein
LEHFTLSKAISRTSRRLTYFIPKDKNSIFCIHIFGRNLYGEILIFIDCHKNNNLIMELILSNFYYSEPADSLSLLEKEYWRERGGDQGFPHVHQWLQQVQEPAMKSEPSIKNELPSSETDDAGNSKRARLYSSTATPRSIDNMAYSCPRSSDHTDLRTAKDGLN